MPRYHTSIWRLGINSRLDAYNYNEENAWNFVKGKFETETPLPLLGDVYNHLAACGQIVVQLLQFDHKEFVHIVSKDAD